MARNAPCGRTGQSLGATPPAHPPDFDAEGMLLYATVGDQDFHHKYSMPPHRMAVATVDLARDWQTVEARLLEVIEIRSNEGTGKKA